MTSAHHMRKHSKLISGSGLLFLFMAVCQDAVAGTPGGTVSYAPYAAQGIPTLSEGMTMVLALLMSVTVFRVLRNKGGRPLAVLVAGALLILGMASSTEWMGRALAIGFQFNVESGGTVNVLVNNIDISIANQTTKPQQITAITPYPGQVAVAPPSATPIMPRCEVTTVVAPSASCVVRFALD